MRIAHAAVIIDARDAVPIPDPDDELNGRAIVLGRADRILEYVGAVDRSVDREYLRALGDPGLECRAIPNDLRYDRLPL